MSRHLRLVLTAYISQNISLPHTNVLVYMLYNTYLVHLTQTQICAKISKSNKNSHLILSFSIQLESKVKTKHIISDCSRWPWPVLKRGGMLPPSSSQLRLLLLTYHLQPQGLYYLTTNILSVFHFPIFQRGPARPCSLFPVF